MTGVTREDYTKVPQDPPDWVGPFMTAVTNEGLDQDKPSRRALLVAEELVAQSMNRGTWLHRFAAALDRKPTLLYRLERQVSPMAPIEQVADHIDRRVECAVRGGDGATGPGWDSVEDSHAIR